MSKVTEYYTEVFEHIAAANRAKQVYVESDGKDSCYLDDACDELSAAVDMLLHAQGLEEVCRDYLASIEE